jgi:hypothetical protein
MSTPSTTRIADYLDAMSRPGTSLDNRYVVLPRIVLEHLPVALLREMVGLLSRMHEMAAELPWPQSYRVEAIRWRSLTGLDETQLRELGIIAELDWNGDLIHRDENTGRPLTSAQLTHPIAELCPDPLYPTSPPHHDSR